MADRTPLAPGPVRILLEGPPKVGKTTVVARLVDLLQEHGRPVGGFVTYEQRSAGRRVGFTVRDIAGPQAVIAHVDFETGVQVGRFQVDVAAFEAVGLPAVREALGRGGVVIIDEVARMELASERFIDILEEVVDQPVPLVATVHAQDHPVTDKLKGRSDTEVLMVTTANRDQLPPWLFERLRQQLPSAE